MHQNAMTANKHKQIRILFTQDFATNNNVTQQKYFHFSQKIAKSEDQTIN